MVIYIGGELYLVVVILIYLVFQVSFVVVIKFKVVMSYILFNILVLCWKFNLLLFCEYDFIFLVIFRKNINIYY